MSNRSKKKLSTSWLFLVFMVSLCVGDQNFQTTFCIGQSTTTGAGTMEPQDDSIFSYKDGAVHIKLENEFNYMITNGFGVVVETGRGKRPLSVGNSLRPGIYSLSVKCTLGLYSESIEIR